MLYRKNLFSWEQATRAVAGLAAFASPWLWGTEPAWIWSAGGAILILTGFLGFCPACYALGRRTPNFIKVERGQAN